MNQRWKNESQPHHSDKGNKSEDMCIFLKGHGVCRPGLSLWGHSMAIGGWGGRESRKDYHGCCHHRGAAAAPQDRTAGAEPQPRTLPLLCSRSGEVGHRGPIRCVNGSACGTVISQVRPRWHLSLAVKGCQRQNQGPSHCGARLCLSDKHPLHKLAAKKPFPGCYKPPARHLSAPSPSTFPRAVK